MKTPLNSFLFGVSVTSALLLVLSNVLGAMAVAQLSSDLSSVEAISAALRNHMQVDMMHDAIRADVNAALLSRSGVTDLPTVREEFTRHTAELRNRIAANTRLPLNTESRSAQQDVYAPLNDYTASADDILTQLETGHTPSAGTLASFKQKFTALEGRMEHVSERIGQQLRLTTRMGEANASVLKEVLSAASILSIGLFILATLLQFGIGTRWFEALGATAIKAVSTLVNRLRRFPNAAV
jgi:methyl-accepting chemotaxis protein